jgi:hypothetical protein
MRENHTVRPEEKKARRNNGWRWAPRLLLATTIVAIGLYCYVRYTFHLDISDGWGQAIVRHMDLSLIGKEALRHRELRGAWPKREADVLETSLHRDLLQSLLEQCSGLEFRVKNNDVLTIAGHMRSSYDLSRVPAVDVRVDGFLLRLSWSERISGQPSASGTPGLTIELTGNMSPEQSPQGLTK